MNKCIVMAGIFAIALGLIGGQWDSWMHAKQGHTLLAVPHLVVIVSLVLFFICGILAFAILKKNKGLSTSKRRGLWLVLAGGIFIPPALIVDEAWHKFFGIDMTAWSLPHAVMFAAVASVLIGLTIFSRRNALTIVFFSTTLMLGIFSLADFEQPHMAWVESIRPGFAYPVTATGIGALVLISVIVFSRQIGIVTATACLAWALHAGIGYLIGAAGGFFHSVLPFPVFIPALALDLWLVSDFSRVKIFPHSQKELFGATLFTATVCYWAIVGWVVLYTGAKLPQQLSGSFSDWLIWYAIFIPVMSYIIAQITSFISRWALQDKKQFSQ